MSRDGYSLPLDGVVLEACGIRWRGNDVRATVSIFRDGLVLHRDGVSLTSAKSRRAFVKSVEQKSGAVIPELALLAIEETIRRASRSPSSPGANASGGEALPPSDADGEPSPYAATPTGLIWYKPTRDDIVPIPLTNFGARIVEDRAEDDGVEVRRAFMIEATLNGRSMRFTVPASSFAQMAWPMDHLGAAAVVFAGMGLKDHARAAIQVLSDQIQERRVFTHLGWRRIGESWCYLHAGGALGPDGPLSGIDLAPPPACARYLLPEAPRGEALVHAMHASLSLLDIAPSRITVPLLAAVARAVLGGADFSIHFAGRTGVFKTEVTALAQQHFGATMDARHLPGSWSSTAYSLEGLGFHVKDGVLVVDDFAPTGSQTDVLRLHRDADRFLRAQGNISGRGRMRPDGTLREPKPPRCLAISTGEDSPRGQSLRARLLVVEMAAGDVDVERLTAAQRDAAAGLYAQALAGFVQWVAPQYEGIRSSLRAEVEALRHAALQAQSHPRTPEIIANLAVAFRLYLRFALDAGALTTEQADARWATSWQALLEAGAAQAEHQQANEPTRRFLELLSTAIASGRAHVAAPDGTAPARAPLPLPHVTVSSGAPRDDTHAKAWGWRRGGLDTDLRPQGERVGWLRGDDLFLLPDAALAVVQDLTRTQGDSFALTGPTLHKRLHERKLLAAVDTERGRLVVRHMFEGRRRAVLHLHADALMPQDAALPAQVAHPSGVQAIPPGPNGPNGPPFQGTPQRGVKDRERSNAVGAPCATNPVPLARTSHNGA